MFGQGEEFIYTKPTDVPIMPGEIYQTEAGSWETQSYERTILTPEGEVVSFQEAGLPWYVIAGLIGGALFLFGKKKRGRGRRR